LLEYDELATTDYYQPAHGGEGDGTITRLHRTQIVDVEDAQSGNPNELQLFPVPTDGILQVNLPSLFINKSNIKVFNSIGQIVFTTRISSSSLVIDLNHLADGYYTIQVNNESTVLNKSFIKQ
jgi:hypothetical protein